MKELDGKRTSGQKDQERMSGAVEESKADYEGVDSSTADAGNLSIALIGPNETHRKTMARALSSSTRRSVREFTDYPAKLNDVPRLLEEGFDVVMVDVDSDESYGLKIIETIAGAGGTVVMAYSRRSDRDLMMTCMRAGARDFLPLPADAKVETSAPVAPMPTPLEEDGYRFSDHADEEPIDELDAVDDDSAFTYDYAAEEKAASLPVASVRGKSPELSAPVNPVSDFDEWDQAHLRFMKSSNGPQVVSRNGTPTEPLPGSVEEWDQAHLRAAESIAAKGAPLVPRSPTVADLFAKAEKAEKQAEVATRLEAPYTPELASKKKKKKEAPSLSVVPSIVPKNDPEPEQERPPIPPEMRARSSKKFQEAPLPVAPPQAASALAPPPLTVPPISHEQFLKPEGQKVDDGSGDMFSRQPDRRRILPPDEPLFKYSAPEEEKKKSGLVPWIIFSMGLGVVVCLVIVFYAHPYGIGLPVVTSSPAAVQTTAPAEPAEKTAGTILDDSAVPAKPAVSARNSEADNTANADPISSSMMDAQLAAKSKLSQDIKKPKSADDGEPAAGFTPSALDSGTAAPGAIFSGSTNGVKVVPASTAISAGVASGLLIHKTAPVYPKFARDARISGTVVLGATIQTSGALSGLHVISGPDALRGSALDAARNWRYRPYMLDNKPVEVQTTINVVFNLGQ